MKNILTIEEQKYVKAMCIVTKMEKETADKDAADVLAFKSSWFYKAYSTLYDVTAIVFSIVIVVAIVTMLMW